MKKTLCTLMIIFTISLFFTGCAAIKGVDKNIQNVNDNIKNVNKGIQDIKKNAQETGNHFLPKDTGSGQEQTPGESESSGQSNESGESQNQERD